ncbi:cobyrinate a,c-diamide synthase [Alkalihalobacillus sp. LMS39]|uniref:cobyrinate a,c-diamide synthase n=1 Tax=Alkalihalobacillus sp. LMS39 TaxID=2924032 RepID=UPI001FB441F6|nr:cobyrinate a,c-diamide synthase [Alkalihalobacillus sp. LMS39]UOE96002.1 cobyrinate a,c-diamide synthase [Alkalihalobacillus sp. LMS39]
MQRRIVIAGTNSGVGKTTLTLGLMSALRQRGLVVQGFKCGPDYIDPSYHTAVTGRHSRNVDSWMLEHDVVKEVFSSASQGADIAIIEGVMGVYDGKSPESNTGSTAEISQLLESPVLLIVNISSMARSAAAIVKGFQMLDESITIAGVIVNQAGSKGHYELCKKAIEKECGVKVLGYLLKGDTPKIPSRHLGLIPAIERGELDGLFTELGEKIAERIDLDAVVHISEQAQEIKYDPVLFSDELVKPTVKIAVAHDAAFNFYYEENLHLLRQAGAELVYFSPLAGETLPKQVDGLYIGGGFPEEFAKELSEHTELQDDIRAVARELPIFAECGGYMYLTERIITTDGQCYPMVGVIQGEVTMQSKLAALGYREVTSLQDNIILQSGEKARGHEFHYSTFACANDNKQKAYHVKALRKDGEEGYSSENIVAGYTHLHFGSNRNIAKRFVRACETYQQKRGSKG